MFSCIGIFLLPVLLPVAGCVPLYPTGIKDPHLLCARAVETFTPLVFPSSLDQSSPEISVRTRRGVIVAVHVQYMYSLHASCGDRIND